MVAFRLSRVSSLYGTLSPISKSSKCAERLFSGSLAEATIRSWLLESLATFVKVSIHRCRLELDLHWVLHVSVDSSSYPRL